MPLIEFVSLKSLFVSSALVLVLDLSLFLYHSPRCTVATTLHPPVATAIKIKWSSLPKELRHWPLNFKVVLLSALILVRPWVLILVPVRSKK